MLITYWGRSANQAKNSGAKCSGLQEGHPLSMDGVREGIREEVTFSCALWRQEQPMQRLRGRKAGAPVETLAAESRT